MFRFILHVTPNILFSFIVKADSDMYPMTHIMRSTCSNFVKYRRVQSFLHGYSMKCIIMYNPSKHITLYTGCVMVRLLYNVVTTLVSKFICNYFQLNIIEIMNYGINYSRQAS